jgi:hypothetical protein
MMRFLGTTNGKMTVEIGAFNRILLCAMVLHASGCPRVIRDCAVNEIVLQVVACGHFTLQLTVFQQHRETPHASAKIP